MKLLPALTIALCAIVGANAQSTTKLTASKVNDYGLVYSLPNTVLDITIETEYTQKEPGEFYNYAKRNLNIADPILKPSLTANIKSITITPRGEANEEDRWLMQFKAGQPIYIMLNEAGVPLAINTENFTTAEKPKLPTPQKAAPTPLETPAAKQAITQDIMLSSSISKRAQLVAERIFELRENRNDLISGQAENTPPDGQSMQLALDNLAAQEAVLTALFAGTVKHWTDVNTLTYAPDTEDVKDFILARLSPVDGIVDASDLSGDPIYLSMSIINKGEIPVDEKGKPREFPKNGVAYTIPGSAQITLTYRGVEVASQTVDLAQLGITYGLDPKIFVDKKAPAYAIFDPATGGIVRLDIKE